MYQHERHWLEVAAEAQTDAFFFLDFLNRTKRAPSVFSESGRRYIAEDRLRHMSVHVTAAASALPGASVPVGPYVSWMAR